MKRHRNLQPSTAPDRRHPLDKENFLEGTRQKWLGVGIGLLLIILFFDIKFDFEAGLYVEAISTLLLAFLIGASATASIKSYKAGNIREAEINKDNYEPSPEPRRHE